MSYAAAVLGSYSGAGYAAQVYDVYAPYAGSVAGPWAGWRLALVTDASGNLLPGQVTSILSVVVGDSINVTLSGPVAPNTSLSLAVLYLDTAASVRVFTTTGTISLDGSTGSYAVSFHVPRAQTGLLTGGVAYLWSVVLTAASGDTWTPVNGAPFYPKTDLAV